MKFKLDENIGNRGKKLFIDAGYDVCTILEQNLAGAPDTKVIGVCQSEKHCLVTLDLDFSNPLVFKPVLYSGIVVLRLPKSSNYQDLLDLIKTLIEALKMNDVDGKLWIIQKGNLRIYEPNE